MINVAVLGSTGSVGTQTLDIIRRFPDRFKVTALSAGNNAALLEAQIKEFKPAVYGVSGNFDIDAAVTKADLVVIAVSGFAALPALYTAAKAGKRIALANKEALVAAGQFVMPLVKKHGAEIIPVDSEHSAIFQCLNGNYRENVKRIILTASGGPLLNTPENELKDIPPEKVVKHPKWNMGRKISVDSATMMNKGLEVIEAHFLFGLPPYKIEVVIHPQSIIHSMVEFCDGAHMAQLGMPDMAVPISYALFYPDRCPDTKVPSVDFPALHKLDFLPLDTAKFPCFQRALDSLKAGGVMPCVLNAANEAAVQLFLDKKISFPDIPRIVASVLDKYNQNVTKASNIDDIINLDAIIKKDIISAY